MLDQMIGELASGKPIDRSSVTALDSSFKYIGASTFRPDIAPGHALIEIRDAHNHVPTLVDRLNRNQQIFVNGPDDFSGLADWPVFDSVGTFKKLPTHLQDFLADTFPSKAKLGLNYTEAESVSLQVYRNFSWPLRDFSRHAHLLGDAALFERVMIAQTSFINKLEQTASARANGIISREQAAIDAQAALAIFVEESELSKSYRNFFSLWLQRQDSKVLHLAQTG
jgi:hypothetical protein